MVSDQRSLIVWFSQTGSGGGYNEGSGGIVKGDERRGIGDRFGEREPKRGCRVPDGGMTEKLNKSRFFPPVELADAEGLVLVGGQLTTAWLLDAYRHGIFPWPVCEAEGLMAWWSPHPRAILELDQLVVSRRLRRRCRSGRFRVTCDQDFAGVLQGCATAGDRAGSTWLIPAMIRAYQKLHEVGCAHSVEVWQDQRLVGGTYGVSLGGYFSAESKFHRASDASKVALLALVSHLRQRGFQLLDIQQLTEHTQRLGGTEIARRDFIQRLTSAQQLPVTFGDRLQFDPAELPD